MSTAQARTHHDQTEINPDLARQFSEAIFSKYLKETTRPAYIEVRGKRESDAKLTFRRFYLGYDLLIKDMSTWSPDRHYWFGVAPRWSDTKGEKEHCLALTVIFIDVDYGTVGHKKENRWQTRGEAQAAIDAFSIKPSIVVHTGFGFQVYWILSEPFGIENGNYAQVEAIMKGIGAVIGGDDGTQDVSRILRIPGTFNVKTDVPRPVEIVRCERERVYDLADFAYYADQIRQEQKQTRQKAPPREGPQTTNIDELNVPAWVKGLIRSGDASGYESRSERDHAVIGALVRAGCNLDTIEAIFQEHPVGDKYREKCGQGRRYLQFSYVKDGSSRPQARPQQPPMDDGQDYAQAEREAIQGEAQELPPDRRGPPQAPTFPEVISAADLENQVFPEIEYLIKDIMPLGFGLLSARPKKGKSYLALNVAAAKSTGGCALGSKELQLEPGTVLYIAYEDKNRRVKNRLTTIMKGESFPQKLYVAETWPRLPDDGLNRLDAWLTANPDAKLVVIDTLGRFKPKKRPRQDDYEADLATGAALADLAHKHNVCILGIYHNRKTESDDPLDDVHGSTGMTAAADFVMVLRRGRGQADAELFVSGRDVEEKTLALRFHKSEGLWELLGDASEVVKSRQRQEIIDLIGQSGPQTVKEVTDYLGKPYETIRKLLQRMTWDGELKVRDGKYYIERW